MALAEASVAGLVAGQNAEFEGHEPTKLGWRASLRVKATGPRGQSDLGHDTGHTATLRWASAAFHGEFAAQPFAGNRPGGPPLSGGIAVNNLI